MPSEPIPYIYETVRARTTTAVVTVELKFAEPGTKLCLHQAGLRAPWKMRLRLMSHFSPGSRQTDRHQVCVLKIETRCIISTEQTNLPARELRSNAATKGCEGEAPPDGEVPVAARVYVLVVNMRLLHGVVGR